MNSILKLPVILINLALVAGSLFFGYSLLDTFPKWQARHSSSEVSKLIEAKKELEAQVSKSNSAQNKLQVVAFTEAKARLASAVTQIKSIEGISVSVTPSVSGTTQIQGISVKSESVTLTGDFLYYEKFKNALASLDYPIMVKSVILNNTHFELILEVAGV